MFVSDLHGNIQNYEKLFNIIKKEKPDGVFFGGDLLPNQFEIKESMNDFIEENILLNINSLKQKTEFFIIMGNDDPRIFEEKFINADKRNIINYVNEKTVKFNEYFVTGYPYIPPSPFQLKDWEKYDVSRFVDVGSVSPEEGIRTIEKNIDDIMYSTISNDLDILVKNADPKKTIFLFHCPPYKTFLDRAALDGKKVDHAPIDVNVGSIAIKKFLSKYKPLLTLHGHVHESSRLTGHWMQKIGDTYSFSASYEGSKLAIIKFDTDDLKNAKRLLI